METKFINYMCLHTRSDGARHMGSTVQVGLQFENFTKMCSGSEAGSYLRLIDFLYHSTLGLRITEKKKKGSSRPSGLRQHSSIQPGPYLHHLQESLHHLRQHPQAHDLKDLIERERERERRGGGGVRCPFQWEGRVWVDHPVYSNIPRYKQVRAPLRNVKRFRGGLVFKAHRLVYHSTLGLGVIKKKKKRYKQVRAPRPSAKGPLIDPRVSLKSP